MALDADITDNVCTTEQLRLLTWIQFFAEFRHRLDADQLKSYLLDMTDSDAAIYPPPYESPRHVEY